MMVPQKGKHYHMTQQFCSRYAVLQRLEDDFSYLLAIVHCNIIHNSQEVEEIYMFLSRLMHKQNCHILMMECYSAFKRREILTYHAV